MEKSFFNDLDDSELFAVLNAFLISNYSENNLNNAHSHFRGLYFICVIPDLIGSNGLGWFYDSKWNTPTLFEEISFFDKNVSSELNALFSGKEELNEIEIDKMYEIFGRLENSLISWARNNEDFFIPYKEAMSACYRDKVLPIVNRMKSFKEQSIN